MHSSTAEYQKRKWPILVKSSASSFGRSVIDRMGKSTPTEGKIEELPDAWERFEKAVEIVAKAGPQHRASKPAKASQKASALAAKSKRRIVRPNEDPQ